MVGLLPATAGKIVVGNRDRAALHPAATAQEVGYVFQNPDHQIFAATVADEVAFGPRNFGLDDAEITRRSDEVLTAVNLAAQRDRDPASSSARVSANASPSPASSPCARAC